MCGAETDSEGAAARRPHPDRRALDDLNGRRTDGQPLDVRDLPRPVVVLETRAGELKLVREPAGMRGYDDLRRSGSHNLRRRGRLGRRSHAHAPRPRPGPILETPTTPPPPHLHRALTQPRARPRPRRRDLRPTMASSRQQLLTRITGEIQIHHPTHTWVGAARRAVNKAHLSAWQAALAYLEDEA